MVAIKSFVLALAASFIGSTTAAPATSPKVSLSSIVGDIVCPRGSQLFHAHNDGLVPNTSPSQVWQYIGNFPNVDWQGFQLLSTTGKANYPGSTRTFSTLGLTLTERLNVNVGSATGSTPYLPIFYQQFTLVGTPAIYGTQVSGVQDFLSVSAKGKDAYISWELVGCANVTETAEAVFEQVHGGAIAGTIAKFKQ